MYSWNLSAILISSAFVVIREKYWARFSYLLLVVNLKLDDKALEVSARSFCSFSSELVLGYELFLPDVRFTWIYLEGLAKVFLLTSKPLSKSENGMFESSSSSKSEPR